MIEEVLKKVRLAEAEAEKTVASAVEQAAEMRSAVEKKCKEILAESKVETKIQVDDILSKATALSEEEYANALKAVENERVNALGKCDERVDDIAEELFRRIVDGDC